MRPRARNATGTVLLLGMSFGAAAAQKQWAVTRTIPVGGDGAWDYVTVDPPGYRVFLTRTTHTMVLDESTGKVLGDIPGQKRAHGTAIVPRLNRGFITDGVAGTVLVFDLKTYAVLGEFAAANDADGIIYDPKIDRVLVSAGDSHSLVVFAPDIDPKFGKPDLIALGGKPEFLASDGSGKVFVNLVDKDLVAVVDVAAKEVVARWPVAPGGQPVGMAMTADHKLVIGCRNPAQMLVMNSGTGQIEAALPIPAGVDANAMDGAEIFASTGDGTLTVAAAKSGKYEVVQSLATFPSARTMGLDPKTHTIYLPAAEMEPGANGRPQPKPDTFKILVVQRR